MRCSILLEDYSHRPTQQLQSEYFARGFEEYTMDNKKEIKQLCPVLYRKIKALYKMED